jgi:RND superfamily putative drug exporter
MPRLLDRIGRFSARHRVAVIIAWVMVAVTAGLLALTGMKFSDGGFEIPGTESSTALTIVEEQFPNTDSDEGRGSLQLVLVAPGGTEMTSPEAIADVTDIRDDVERLDGVAAVGDPYNPLAGKLSRDLSTVVIDVEYGALDDAEAAAESLSRVADAAREDGYQAEVGGTIANPVPEIMGPSEIVGAVIAFLVLLITFGSMRAAGANMVSAVTGVAVGVLGVLAASALSPIGSTTPILAVMLGLAVGIDYGLFVLARFRADLREGREVTDAIGHAVGTAGTSVVFAGFTVIIALVGLAVVNIPFITEMGLAGAFGVLVAVLVSLTLLPALMSFVGRRALPREERALTRSTFAATEERTRISVLERWGATVVKRPVAALVGSLAVLAALSVPLLSMTTSLAVPGGEDAHSTQRHAYDIVADKFGEGFQDPLVVLVEASDAATAAPAVADRLGQLDGVELAVAGPTSSDGAFALVSVIADGGPVEESTRALVHDMRELSDSVDDATFMVTGQTAIGIDVDERLSEALVTYILLIVGLAVVLLILLFRSLLVPVVAALGFLLSLGAALGVTTAVFQWGWLDPIIAAPQGNPLMSLIPLLVVGILFGLAMDYQVFLVSRIHEAHSKGLTPKEAILDGFGRSAFVVVAAALIMFAVFGGFAFSGHTIVASIALALAVGVLADAFIVRMIIVPAVLGLAGRAAWWMPRWLDRVLPRIDAEGASLDVVQNGATQPNAPAMSSR